MNTAPEEVRTGMKVLQSSEKADVCERCQKTKEIMCGLVCDAGQFYETVSARQAMMAMSDLCETRVILAVQRSSCTITKGVLWRSAQCTVRTHVVFLAGRAQKFFGVAVCVSLTGLDDRVARRNGLPIGGLLSKVVASVVLFQEEREWSDNEGAK